MVEGAIIANGAFGGQGNGLTNLNASNISSGTVADARLSANVALLNANQAFTGSNSFSGVATLANPNNTLSGNGSGLTSLNAANISSGTLADPRLSSNVSLLNANQTFSGSNSFSGVATLANPNNTLSGNGSGLTSLNAANVSSGTVADARLSANVALLNRSPQTFSGSSNLFSGSITIGPAGAPLKSLRTGSILIGTNSTVSKIVTNTFASTFTTTPRILVSGQNDSTSLLSDIFAFGVRSITTSNVVLNVRRLDTATGWTQNLEVNYMAWEP
jgi:hypothetical protein